MSMTVADCKHQYDSLARLLLLSGQCDRVAVIAFDYPYIVSKLRLWFRCGWIVECYRMSMSRISG